MRRGFEGNVFINTGSAASPTWLPVDVVDDVTIEDDSEQHGTEHRGQRGNATKARGLLSLKVSFAVESDANAPEVIAALLTAARERDAVGLPRGGTHRRLDCAKEDRRARQAL